MNASILEFFKPLELHFETFLLGLVSVSEKVGKSMADLGIIIQNENKDNTMNIKEWAELLDGREYGEELTSDEASNARNEGVAIITGQGDDTLAINGAIHDFADVYNGGDVFINQQGVIQNQCGNNDCHHYKKEKEQATKITAIWECLGYSWVYDTDVPYETFTIYEDDETYCNGIVFELSSVSKGD